MLNVEMRYYKNDDPADNENSAYLVINGQEVPNSWCSVYKKEFGIHNKNIVASISDDKTVKLLCSQSFAALKENFDALYIACFDNEFEDLTDLSIELSRYKQSPHLKFEFRVDLDNWARPYSVLKLAKYIEETIEELAIPNLSFYQDDELVVNGFGFKCSIVDLESIARDEILSWKPYIEKIADIVNEKLHSDISKNTFVTLFKFPEEIAIACEQYLVYFAQFLADLGVEADVNLNHDSPQRVLFSVTPRNSDDALETIRDALAVYLQLPGNAEFKKAASDSSEAAVLQLQSNIMHLEGQAYLNKAINNANQAMIQALQLSNYRLQQIVDANANLNQLQLASQSPQPVKKDSEPIIGGLLSVREFEIKGIVVNTPELVRRLKRKFRKNN